MKKETTPLEVITSKEMLTSDEVAWYLGISKAQLYMLTARRAIPHYKPTGKLLYFKRGEIDEWLQSNRVATDTEIADKALKYCSKKGGAR